MLVIALVMGIIVYKFGIKRTLSAYTETIQLRSEIEQASTAPQVSVLLHHQIEQLDQQLSESATDATESDQALLAMVSAYCDERKLVVVDFPKALVTPEDQLLLESNRMVIQGSFEELQGLVFTIEHQPKLGKIVSLTYQLRKDPKSAQKVLQAEIYLERVKHINA